MFTFYIFICPLKPKLLKKFQEVSRDWYSQDYKRHDAFYDTLCTGLFRCPD